LVVAGRARLVELDQSRGTGHQTKILTQGRKTMVERLIIGLVFVFAFLCTLFFNVRQSFSQRLDAQLKANSLEQLAVDAEQYGDPLRGAIAFFQPTLNCARCHEPQSGRRLGPDLSEKREVVLAHLIESLLDPSAKITEGFQSVSVLLEDGQQINGVLIDETDSELVVDRIEQTAQPLKIPKSEIDQWKPTKISTMPTGLVNQLTDKQQFFDLASYLNEVSAGGPARALELRPTNLAVVAPLPDYESRVNHAGMIRSLDAESFVRGEETYRLRCASCHGTFTEEGSMPTSLRFADGKFKNGNDPYRMYQTLTHGYGLMLSQRWMVPQQKYEVIHYLREQFLKENNPDQHFEITDEYLASLPKGNTRGPAPVVSRPWTTMDYGSSFINTIEVSDDGSNIAQKGITIRLDDGPGGVASGKYWMMYDHDTMRLAGAWSDRFIDFEGISFNGAHGRHPSVSGNVQFANPTGPGWARPKDESLADNRLIGRDEKRYGPLARDWAQYKGMYRFANRTIIEYSVGKTDILESPGLSFVDQQPVFKRTLNLGQREQDLILKISTIDGGSLQKGDSQAAVVLAAAEPPVAEPSDESDSIQFDGSFFGEVALGEAFDMHQSDYSITARIKTTQDGTLFSQTQSQKAWMADGKSLFLRDGKLTFDIGWVGAVTSDKKVNDGKWHDVAMTWSADDGRVGFFVDGKPAGDGELRPKVKLEKRVARIGFTNENFPSDSMFTGAIADLKFYQRKLSATEIFSGDVQAKKLVGHWNRRDGNSLFGSLRTRLETTVKTIQPRSSELPSLLASFTVDSETVKPDWEYKDQCLLLRIPTGDPVNLEIAHVAFKTGDVDTKRLAKEIRSDQQPAALKPLILGGPKNWPEILKSPLIRDTTSGPFAVDVFERPTKNPWNAQLRLTGIDFLPDGNTLVAAAWDGSVWRVSGFSDETTKEITWQRIAAGLFQPLGIKWIDGKIFVTCRDQLAVLHDLNGNGETDWYQCLNNDHQVTEHFHEFAMGLQTDEKGNFYYAKSARHAKTALVPHHGTLLKVSPDGEQTEILANGFRAANGVCINPDGSFLVTDQEGHWNPKNRINWVRSGEFYGNMFGYHDITDDSDSAMQDPLCWITNEFDRSPSELLWVDSGQWGPLNGSLLNFSYGFGEIHIVPHEQVDGKMQGGLCAFPLPRFPTGVMRGRFHPQDGQLYCCGMFAWSSSQTQPGGLYRVRYTGKPVHLPTGLRATTDGIEVEFSGKLDEASAADVANFSIKSWGLKRTANYGSDHYNEQKLQIEKANLLEDGRTVRLSIPDIKPTWGMEIKFSLKSDRGKPVTGRIHNSIFRLKKN
jgi:putative heme-binding domain-containing protein